MDVSYVYVQYYMQQKIIQLECCLLLDAPITIILCIFHLYHLAVKLCIYKHSWIYAILVQQVLDHGALLSVLMDN